MSFLIDTDTASAHLRGTRNVTSRLLQYTGRLYMSTVSLAELKSWIYRRKTPVKYRRGLSDMLQRAGFCCHTASAYCRLGATVRFSEPWFTMTE
jgi:predicted nucleic acid-binding protein